MYREVKKRKNGLKITKQKTVLADLQYTIGAGNTNIATCVFWMIGHAKRQHSGQLPWMLEQLSEIIDEVHRR